MLGWGIEIFRRDLERVSVIDCMWGVRKGREEKLVVRFLILGSVIGKIKETKKSWIEGLWGFLDFGVYGYRGCLFFLGLCFLVRKCEGSRGKVCVSFVF